MRAGDDLARGSARRGRERYPIRRFGRRIPLPEPPPPPPRHPRLRLGWRLTRILIGILAAACGVLGFLTAYAAVTLPSSNAIGKATGSMRILDAKGRLIAEVSNSGGNNHTAVRLDQVAPIMQQATVSTEDREFYQEGSINPKRIAKALFVDVLAGRPEEGASTITQQLAKLAFLPQDKTALRKLRQALLANQLDSRYTKQQILEMYLNIVYYGHGAYGVQNAAQTYFGKDASQLTLTEASLLAGLPQAPSLDDPFQNPNGAFARQHVVLQSLVATNSISQQLADSLDPTQGDATTRQQAVIAELRQGHAPQGVTAPHFVQYVRNELAQHFGSESSVFDESITVTTSLDLDDQHRAEQAVSAGVAKLSGQGADNGALMMLDTRHSHQGEIRAMVGSANYDDASIDGQFNVVTAERRPGSSFKPFVYEQGFRSHRLSPSSTLDDTAQESGRLNGVQDYDNRFLGRMSAARALLLSRNVPTEQAMLMTGVSDVIDFAHSLGITSQLADNASTGIGSSAVRMIDEASAYGAFATGGQKVTAHSVLTVVDGSGTTLLDQTNAGGGDQVMTASDAGQINSILRGYPRQWNIPINRPTAGKSGTTDRFVDAWYMAYSPDFVVASWVGRTDASVNGEQPMNQVFGTDVGKAMTAPFVNGITLPSHDFANSSSNSFGCEGGGCGPADVGNQSGNGNPGGGGKRHKRG